MVPHMLLRELAISFNDIPMRKGGDGAYVPINPSISRADLLRHNPAGRVPTLLLEDGTAITEMPAVLTYISSLSSQRFMMGHTGMEAARVYEWIAFVQGALLEYGFAARWQPERLLPANANKEMEDAVRDEGGRKILSCLETMEARLDDSGHAVGRRLTVIDLLVLPSWQWATMMNLDLAEYPKLGNVVKQTLKLESVREVLKIEGITSLLMS
jgi:glutathione S-transferase